MEQLIDLEELCSKYSFDVERHLRDELQLMANHAHKSKLIEQPSINLLVNSFCRKWLDMTKTSKDKILCIPQVTLECYVNQVSGRLLLIDEDDKHDKEITISMDLFRELDDYFAISDSVAIAEGTEDGVQHTIPFRFKTETGSIHPIIACFITILVYEESVLVGIITRNTDNPIFSFKAHGRNMHRGAIRNKTELLFLNRNTKEPLMYFTQPRTYVIGDDKVYLDSLDSGGRSLSQMIESLVQPSQQQQITDYHNPDYSLDDQSPDYEDQEIGRS